MRAEVFVPQGAAADSPRRRSLGGQSGLLASPAGLPSEATDVAVSRRPSHAAQRVPSARQSGEHTRTFQEHERLIIYFCGVVAGRRLCVDLPRE